MEKSINSWLLLNCFLVLVMIFLGGLTRLTDSGLSITQWHPISGIIPPLNGIAWQEEFTKYQLSPEFIKLNNGMILSEFKRIYWMEFIHRIMGRIVFLTYALPLIFWSVTGRLKLNSCKLLYFVLFLILMQGAMGWYMVKSGLVSNPHVSHYRLAAHLLLAVTIYSLLLWRFFGNIASYLILPAAIRVKGVFWLSCCVSFFAFAQIGVGALVAGLDAGLVYNSFPLMGDSFVPHELFFIGWSGDLLQDAACVQFFHRMMAYLVVLVSSLLIFCCRKIENDKIMRAIWMVAICLALQFTLGVVTLLTMVHLHVALLHQIGAVILLTAILWLNFLLAKASKW